MEEEEDNHEDSAAVTNASRSEAGVSPDEDSVRARAARNPGPQLDWHIPGTLGQLRFFVRNYILTMPVYS